MSWRPLGELPVSTTESQKEADAPRPLSRSVRGPSHTGMMEYDAARASVEGMMSQLPMAAQGKR